MEDQDGEDKLLWFTKEDLGREGTHFYCSTALQYCTSMCWYVHYWESVSKTHTSEFNVELCLYGTSRYRGQLIVVSSAGHSYHMPLLPSCVPFVSFFEQIPRLSDTDRGRGKKEGQRLGMKELPVFSDTERGGLLRLQMARDTRFQHCLCVATLLTLTPQCSTFT